MKKKEKENRKGGSCDILKYWRGVIRARLRICKTVVHVTVLSGALNCMNFDKFVQGSSFCEEWNQGSQNNTGPQ